MPFPAIYGILNYNVHIIPYFPQGYGRTACGSRKNPGGDFLKKKKLWLWLLLTFLWMGLIFWQSSRTATESRAESLGLLYYVQKIFPWMTHTLLRKLAHFGEYAVLGWLLTGALYRAKNFLLLEPLAAGLFLALCDETLQLFVAGRGSQVRDIWIDLAGITTGTLILWLYYRLRKR